MSVFKCYGPLAPDSPLFRGRTAELRQLVDLCVGEIGPYALLLGGRQVGKTTLLKRLSATLPESTLKCRVDLQKLTGASRSQLYSYLAQSVMRHIPTPAERGTVDNIEDVITLLLEAIQYSQDKKLVLMLEELGTLPPEARIALANDVRFLLSNRGDIYPGLEGLMVILAGSIEVHDLAAVVVSPLFNVCTKIYLPDLDENDARGLVADGLRQLGVRSALADALGKAVYDRVRGHPYLTQRLGLSLETDLRQGLQLTEERVEAAAEWVLRDDPLLLHIRTGVEERQLQSAVATLQDRQVPFDRGHLGMARLELLGVAAERAGCWHVRNRLLDRALTAWFPREAPPNSHESSTTREVPAVTWLHLSDFHVGKDDYGQRQLFRYILDHVRTRVEGGFGPDLILISGDIANQGRPEQYGKFNTEFLLPLKRLVSTECAERILMVPGNHDIDRTKAQAIRTYGILAEIPSFLDPTEQGKAKRKYLFDRLRALVRNDSTIQKKPHWLFSREGAMVRILQVSGLRIGIAGINTAWLSCSDDDRHRLSPGKGILETALELLQDCDVRVVLGHHPIDWLLDDETHMVRALLGKYGAIYLHGHLHKTALHCEYGAGKPLLALGSGACFQARENEVWVNRLLWCRLDFSARRLEVEPLQWAKDNQEWVVDAAAFPSSLRRSGTDHWGFALP